jgi:inner membrane protein
MDNICHTLVGGALARAGFDKRTPLATATMMIGANFPDIDVVAVFLGNQLSVRRGITHGVPALIILPFVLTGIMMVWDRWVRRRRDPSLPAAIPRQLLLLAAIAILTHPFFDWLNTYGMRWLMPIVDRWYYGDSLFIIDPWIWAALAVGFVASGRKDSPKPARVALAASAAYIVMMMAGSLYVRSKVRAANGQRPEFLAASLMVAPVPANPFARQIMIADRDVYRTGRFSFFDGEIRMEGSIPIGRDHPAVAAALRDPEIRKFMHWARFPFFRVEKNGATSIVHIADARYNDAAGRGWAAVSIEVPTP